MFIAVLRVVFFRSVILRLEISMPFFKKINCITLPFVCFYGSVTMALLKPKHIYMSIKGCVEMDCCHLWS